MTRSARVTFVFLFLWLLWPAAWRSEAMAWAQEPASSNPVRQTQAKSESETDSGSPGLGKADQLLRLERIVAADKEKLAGIKEDLANREAFFDKLSVDIRELETELAEQRERLDEMGGVEASSDAANLAEEIQNREKMLALVKNQSEITFESARTLQNQILGLERKIQQEQRAIEDLTGPSASDIAASTDAAMAETPTEEAVEEGPSSDLPGMARAVTSPEKTPAKGRESLPETAEQIEARHQAEEAEQEARKAEEAVVSFVELKASLESQIEMEQQLVQTAQESRDNLQVGLETAQSELNRLIAADAERAELQRARRTIDTIEGLLQESREEIDKRRADLDSLYQRMESVQEEQLAIVQQAEAKRLEAAEARKKSLWLESPLHPKNLWRWISTRGPRMLLVVFVTWALLMLVRMTAKPVANTVVGKRRTESTRGVNRADTLALSFRSAVSLFIVVAGVLLVFQEAGVDIKTVLGGAAILGVALAFGAQNLMRDYFTGFMILLEDQYELGDLITIGDITGRVEKVNMRTTVLRDLEGRVHFIPNGEIKSVTNRTYVWGRAVIDIPIGYRENVDRAMAIILEVAEEFRRDPEVGDWVTDDPVMLGVDKFTENGAIIKFMIQTRPDKIFATRRELLRRIKNKFDAKGVRISVPHRILVEDSGEVEEWQPERPVESAASAEDESADQGDE